MSKKITEKLLQAEIIRPKLLYNWKRIIFIIVIANLVNLAASISLISSFPLDFNAWALACIGVVTSLVIFFVVICTLLNPKIQEKKEKMLMKLK